MATQHPKGAKSLRDAGAFAKARGANLVHPLGSPAPFKTAIATGYVTILPIPVNLNRMICFNTGEY